MTILKRKRAKAKATTTDESVIPSSAKPPLKERLSKTFLTKFAARRRLGERFDRVPERLHRTANQLSLGLELIDDFRTRRYRAIPWGSLAVLTGALLYTVSPADVLPDALIGLGSLDDAIILAVAMKLIRPQLEAYCAFKGYAWEDYFGAPTKELSGPPKSGPVLVQPADASV